MVLISEKSLTREVLSQLVLRRLKLRLEDGVPASGGLEVQFNCPFCTSRGETNSDTRRRMYLHVAFDDKFGVYNCFRCGKKGRLVKSQFGGLRFQREVVTEPEIEMPVGYSPVTPEMNAYSYLMNRGLKPEDIVYYQIGVAKGRIVFLDFNEVGALEYWVARDYSGWSPKYLNSKGGRRTKLYNLGRFLNEGYKSLVVTEGPISAIVAGRDAVASYGKHVTEEQVEKIRSLKLDEVYVALDPDAKEESLKLASSLCEFCGVVYLVPMPKGEDPASLGREAFEVCKRRAILFDRYDKSGQIRFRMGVYDAQPSRGSIHDD